MTRSKKHLASDEPRMLKSWIANGLTCKVWRESKDVLRGCVFVGTTPVRGTELAQRNDSDSDALGELVETLEVLAARETRPKGPFVITMNTPFTDIAMKLEPNSKIPEEAWVKQEVSLAADLHILPRDWELTRLILKACDPPGLNKSLGIDLRSPQYILVRSNPPREPHFAWDSDQRIRMALALSRLVRPTSFGTVYSGRLIGSLDGRYEFIPGAVRGNEARVWTSEPEHDWFSSDDFATWAKVVVKWDANPLPRRSRLGQAFWYYAYATQTELIDIRWPLIATGLETILSSGSDQSTRDFTTRVPLVASRLQIEGVGRKETSRMWGLRSALSHGSKHGGLGEEEFAIYRLMERVLRELLLNGVLDEDFRNLFSSADSVAENFPVPVGPPRRIECPECHSLLEMPVVNSQRNARVSA